MSDARSEPHGAAVPALLGPPVDVLAHAGHCRGPWDADGLVFLCKWTENETACLPFGPVIALLVAALNFTVVNQFLSSEAVQD